LIGKTDEGLEHDLIKWLLCHFTVTWLESKS